MARIVFSFNLPRATRVTKPLPTNPCPHCPEQPETADRRMLRNPNALTHERGNRSGLLDRVGNAANLINMKAQADLEATPNGFGFTCGL
jgi:hypothetical protein